MFQREIDQSVQFLASDEALKIVGEDPYWPKWDGPWWQMLLLHEIGETKRIPERMIERFVERMDQYPVKIFPIHEHELPAGVDPFRGTMCHCQLGTVYQVLAEWGVDVDRELPWMRPWFLRYQMSDGGMNCDNSAYLVKDEVPSSMVGLISCFEAVLKYTPRAWTPEEEKFLEKGAKFLIERELRLGSSTKHNASERESAKDWVKLCFPRFYFYDVLRGLSALMLWREKTGGDVPAAAIREVVSLLEAKFTDGQLRVERVAFDKVNTLSPSASGEWVRGPAAGFPLLERVSAVGTVSPWLTAAFAEVRKQLSR